jgi:hypothetical protein
MSTQRHFWNLVDSGEIEVINKQACIDALRDTPDIDFLPFIFEALEYEWIEFANTFQYEGYDFPYLIVDGADKVILDDRFYDDELQELMENGDIQEDDIKRAILVNVCDLSVDEAYEAV